MVNFKLYRLLYINIDKLFVKNNKYLQKTKN